MFYRDTVNHFLRFVRQTFDEGGLGYPVLDELSPAERSRGGIGVDRVEAKRFDAAVNFLNLIAKEGQKLLHNEGGYRLELGETLEDARSRPGNFTTRDLIWAPYYVALLKKLRSGDDESAIVSWLSENLRVKFCERLRRAIHAAFAEKKHSRKAQRILEAVFGAGGNRWSHASEALKNSAHYLGAIGARTKAHASKGKTAELLQSNRQLTPTAYRQVSAANPRAARVAPLGDDLKALTLKRARNRGKPIDKRFEERGPEGARALNRPLESVRGYSKKIAKYEEKIAPTALPKPWRFGLHPFDLWDFAVDVLGYSHEELLESFDVWRKRDEGRGVWVEQYKKMWPYYFPTPDDKKTISPPSRRPSPNRA